MKGEDFMNKDEQATFFIDKLMDIRRAKNSPDRDQELADQEQITIAKLEALGITVANLPNPK